MEAEKTQKIIRKRTRFVLEKHSWRSVLPAGVLFLVGALIILGVKNFFPSYVEPPISSEFGASDPLSSEAAAPDSALQLEATPELTAVPDEGLPEQNRFLAENEALLKNASVALQDVQNIYLDARAKNAHDLFEQRFRDDPAQTKIIVQRETLRALLASSSSQEVFLEATSVSGSAALYLRLFQQGATTGVNTEEEISTEECWVAYFKSSTGKIFPALRGCVGALRNNEQSFFLTGELLEEKEAEGTFVRYFAAEIPKKIDARSKLYEIDSASAPRWLETEFRWKSLISNEFKTRILSLQTEERKN